VRSYRAAISSRGVQATHIRRVCTIQVDFSMAITADSPSIPQLVKYHCVEEEIAYGPACWLWDYLRRSGASGFFLPLSGGADSGATASMVGVMSNLVVKAVQVYPLLFLGLLLFLVLLFLSICL